MVKCVKCGAVLDEDARFCDKCGASVKGDNDNSYEQVKSGARTIRKCPNCGDPIDAMELICDKCGYNFTEQRVSTSQERLLAQLSAIDKKMQGCRMEDIVRYKEQKATCINTFQVANNAEEIVSFALFARANACGIVVHDPGDYMIKRAWISKIEQMYKTACASFPNEPIFKQLEEINEEIHAVVAKEEKQGKRAAFFEMIRIPAIVVIFILLMIGLYKWGTSGFDDSEAEHKEREQKYEQLVQEIQADIANGDYDAALIKANSLHMDDGWSTESKEHWDKEREFLINLINEKAGYNLTQDETEEEDEEDEEGKELDEYYDEDTDYSAGIIDEYKEMFKEIWEIFDGENKDDSNDGKVSVGSYKNYRKKNYEYVVALLKARGFTNFQIIDLNDAGFMKKENTVKEISIGGKTKFKKKDRFSLDDPVIITHHGKKKDKD
jgi:predicted nucleic acid-binding Zn ribbon protein